MTALLVLAPLAAAAPAHAQTACGATVTASLTLAADLTDCPGDGLVVGADNVTIDLGSRTIDGTGATGSVGVRMAGRRGVRIVGGTIREFATGISLTRSDRNRLTRVRVHAVEGRAIDVLDSSDRNVFERVISTGNRTGIALTASARNVIRRGTFSRNAVTGVLLLGAAANRVEANRVAGNVGNGIAVVEGSNGNVVTGNRVQGAQTGLIVDGSDRNRLERNVVRGSGDGVLVSGSRNTVAGNEVDGADGECETCSGWGIGVTGGRDNAIRANTVRESASHGIRAARRGARVAANVAILNGGLGILALPGNRDGGGNRAAGNRTEAQCAGVVCAATPLPVAMCSAARARTPRPAARMTCAALRGRT